jgi:hypothetical protein
MTTENRGPGRPRKNPEVEPVAKPKETEVILFNGYFPLDGRGKFKKGTRVSLPVAEAKALVDDKKAMRADPYPDGTPAVVEGEKVEKA